MIRVERKIYRFRSRRSSRAPELVTGTFTNIIPYRLVKARCINGENAEVPVRTQHLELGGSIQLHVRKQQLQMHPWPKRCIRPPTCLGLPRPRSAVKVSGLRPLM